MNVKELLYKNIPECDDKKGSENIVIGSLQIHTCKDGTLEPIDFKI